jgi:hypothetical protein
MAAVCLLRVALAACSCIGVAGAPASFSASLIVPVVMGHVRLLFRFLVDADERPLPREDSAIVQDLP